MTAILDPLHRAWQQLGAPEPPPVVAALPDEWQPDPALARRVWRVTGWTPDGTTPGPAGTWAAYLPAEALQAIVAQARAEGWPVASLRWTVTEEP